MAGTVPSTGDAGGKENKQCTALNDSRDGGQVTKIDTYHIKGMRTGKKNKEYRR